MLQSYKETGARISITMHFLDSHLKLFPENIGDVSNNHGEQLH